MVYDLTLSYNPKKDICHGQGAHAIAMGFWRKERIIIIKNNNNSDRNNSSSDSPIVCELVESICIFVYNL